MRTGSRFCEMQSKIGMLVVTGEPPGLHGSIENAEKALQGPCDLAACMLHALSKSASLCLRILLRLILTRCAACKLISHRDLVMPSQMQKLTSATAAEFSTRTHRKHGI